VATSAWGLIQGFDNLQDAQIGVDKAMLTAKSTANAAEDAQTRYNAVVAKYGPASAEAAASLKDLELAQERASVAGDRATMVQDNLKESYVSFALGVVPSGITMIKGLTDVTKNLGGVTEITKTITGGLGDALSFITKHPILIVIGALVAAFIYAYQNIEPFRNAVNALASFLAGALKPIIEAVSGAFTWLGNVWASITGQAKPLQAATMGLAGATENAMEVATLTTLRTKELDDAYASLTPKVDAVTRAQENLADRQDTAAAASAALQDAQDDLQATIEYVTGSVSELKFGTDDAVWSSNLARTAYANLDTELSGLQGTLDATTGAMRELQGQMDGNGLQTQTLRLEQMKLRDAFEDGRISEEQYKTQSKALDSKMRDLQITGAELDLQMRGLKDTHEEEADAVQGVKDKMDLLKTANDKVVTATDANTTAQKALQTAQEALNTAVQALQTALNEVQTKLKLTQTELEKLKGKLDPAKTSADALKTAIDSIPDSKTITVTTLYAYEASAAYAASKQAQSDAIQKAMAGLAAKNVVPTTGVGGVEYSTAIAGGGWYSPAAGSYYLTEEAARAHEAAALGTVKKGQFGLEAMVSRPTLFMAGEAGPERVSVQPVGESKGRGGVTNNWSIYVSTGPVNGLAGAEELADIIYEKISQRVRNEMKAGAFYVRGY
jgi:regulator of replication initiation timing